MLNNNLLKVMETDKSQAGNNQTNIYQQQLLELIDQRKQLTNMIIQTINQEDVFFLQTFQIGDSIPVQLQKQDKQRSLTFLKNYLILGMMFG